MGEQTLEAYSGLLVAIIYCYLNHEVQVEIGRFIMNTKMRWIIFEERKTEVEEFRKRGTKSAILKSTDKMKKKRPKSERAKRNRMFLNRFCRRSRSIPNARTSDSVSERDDKRR